MAEETYRDPSTAPSLLRRSGLLDDRRIEISEMLNCFSSTFRRQESKTRRWAIRCKPFLRSVRLPLRIGCFFHDEFDIMISSMGREGPSWRNLLSVTWRAG